MPGSGFVFAVTLNFSFTKQDGFALLGDLDEGVSDNTNEYPDLDVAKITVSDVHSNNNHPQEYRDQPADVAVQDQIFQRFYVFELHRALKLIIHANGHGLTVQELAFRVEPHAPAEGNIHPDDKPGAFVQIRLLALAKVLFPMEVIHP